MAFNQEFYDRVTNRMQELPDVRQWQLLCEMNAQIAAEGGVTLVQVDRMVSGIVLQEERKRLREAEAVREVEP